MTGSANFGTGTLQSEVRVEMSVGFSWTELGEISVDDDRRLVFPTAPRAPGIYRFDITTAGKISFYAGQTDNVARRFQHYRTPGRSQQTNIRLNRVMTETLQDRGCVSVATITYGASVLIEREHRTVDLASKSEHLFLGHAAILMFLNRGVETHNFL